MPFEPAARTFALLALAWCVPATAQDRFEQGPEELFPSRLDDDDPLSLGTTATLGDVPDAPVRPPAVQEGPVLSSIPGVREVDHDLSVRLLDGLALVSVRQRFIHRGRFDAELRYRVPLPSGASLVSLEACNESACSEAGPYEGFSEGDPAVQERDAPLRAAGARLALVDDVAWLHIAPVLPGHTSEVRWQVLVPLHVRGGMAQLHLPARGYDLRTATSTVLVLAGDYGEALVQGTRAGTRPIAVEAADPLRIEASVQRARRTTRPFACATGRCERTYVESPYSHRRGARWTLLLDTSPSTRAAGRDELTSLTRALVNTAPADAHFRVFAFAARTRAVVERWTARAEVAPDLVARARMEELGPATRLGVALRQAAPAVGEQVVVVGDGTVSRAAWPELEGVSMHYVHYGPAPMDRELARAITGSGGRIVRFRAGQDAALELASLLALEVEGNVAGDGRAQFRTTSRRPDADPTSRALAGVALLEVQGAPERVVRTANVPSPPPPAVDDGSESLPAAPMLRLLRSRIIPAARACFRRERRGRANHSRRAAYHLALQRGEVMEVRVEGDLPAPLRTCLEEAALRLEVPYANGRVRIQYALHTQAEAPLASIELEHEVASGVDAAIERIEVRSDADYDAFLRGDR